MTERRFLLDSNVLIYLLEGSSPVLTARVENCEVDSVCTSAICLSEVEVGLAEASPLVRDRLKALLSAIPALPFDSAAAEVFGRLAFRRGQFDRLIAAHALSLDLTLVTNNLRDFDDVEGLRVENWTAA